ncbi:MAG: lipoprotein signal peptidase [Spirosomaceae bacterium]|nr:lipoprotein signal peptidase [Spirosomataceae bacterium]
MKSSIKYFAFAAFLIIIDQAIKLWMHYWVRPTHFGEIDIIPNVFQLHYVTNPGMAFGMELGGEYGKLILTTFRLFAMVGIGWYLAHLANRNATKGLLWSIAAVLGGAIGNVIDSTFYGVLLDNAPAEASTPWFHGQVVDMFYFNILDGYYPEWIPILGGQYNTVPIFNFADACIFCGVVTILIFQKSFFAESYPEFMGEEPTVTEKEIPTESTENIESTFNQEQVVETIENEITESSAEDKLTGVDAEKSGDTGNS